MRLSHDQPVTEQDIAKAGVMLTLSDIENGISAARLSYSESIGAPKIPNVSWDDVGGLASVKSDILDTIQLPLEHPELFAEGLKKRSGEQLYDWRVQLNRPDLILKVFCSTAHPVLGRRSSRRLSQRHVHLISSQSKALNY